MFTVDPNAESQAMESWNTWSQPETREEVSFLLKLFGPFFG
jgi:hypothetical protein